MHDFDWADEVLHVQIGRRCLFPDVPGGVEEVLVEGTSRTDPSLLRGRTRRNTTVNFAGTAVPGELVDVRIEDATSTTLRGVQAVPVAA